MTGQADPHAVEGANQQLAMARDAVREAQDSAVRARRAATRAAREASRAGLGVEEIARALGCSTATVKRMVGLV